MQDDVKSLIMLNALQGLGYKRIMTLLERFGTAEQILSAREAELMKAPNIGPVLSRQIVEVRKNFDVDRELNLIRKHKIKVITIFDEGYPPNLKEIYDPPPVLYIKGEILSLDSAAVAMVGSRRPSYYGLSTTERLAGELGARGMTIVSGMARGVDTASHRGALKAGGRTVAVLGSGLAQIYPPENGRLADEISKSGAVISEFPMEMPPHKQNFPQRNRVISGLSLGVVVIEAARYSGSLITAGCALEQGREVFAVPGDAKKANAQGTNRLIRQGAKLVEDAEDIIEELQPQLESYLKQYVSGQRENRDRGKNRDRYRFSGETGKTVSVPIFPPVPIFSLSTKEKKIHEILSTEPMHIEAIIQKVNLPPSAVATSLVNLTIKGLLRELPGKLFVKNATQINTDSSYNKVYD